MNNDQPEKYRNRDYYISYFVSYEYKRPHATRAKIQSTELEESLLPIEYDTPHTQSVYVGFSPSPQFGRGYWWENFGDNPKGWVIPRISDSDGWITSDPSDSLVSSQIFLGNIWNVVMSQKPKLLFAAEYDQKISDVYLNQMPDLMVGVRANKARLIQVMHRFDISVILNYSLAMLAGHDFSNSKPVLSDSFSHMKEISYLAGQFISEVEFSYEEDITIQFSKYFENKKPTLFKNTYKLVKEINKTEGVWGKEKILKEIINTNRGDGLFDFGDMFQKAGREARVDAAFEFMGELSRRKISPSYFEKNLTPTEYQDLRDRVWYAGQQAKAREQVSLLLSLL